MFRAECGHLLATLEAMQVKNTGLKEQIELGRMEYQLLTETIAPQHIVDKINACYLKWHP